MAADLEHRDPGHAKFRKLQLPQIFGGFFAVYVKHNIAFCTGSCSFF